MKLEAINISDPRSEWADREASSISAYLSLYGARGINTDAFKIDWIPENQDERENLHLMSFSHQAADDVDLPREIIPPEVIARCIAVAQSDPDLVEALTFFQYGHADMNQSRYVDAFYDFFFVLESLFANGKFKSHAVKEEFRNSIELQETIAPIIQENSREAAFLRRDNSELWKTHCDGKTCKQISDFLVDTRGTLHHHNKKMRRKWSPTRQREYKFHAELIDQIASSLCLKFGIKSMFELSVDSLKSTVRLLQTET